MTTVRNFVLGLASIAAAGAIAMPAAPVMAGDDVVRIRCKARAPGIKINGDHRLRLRGEVVRRKTFKAEFSAFPGGSYSVGQTMTVLIGTRDVGSKPLIVRADGRIGAEFKLDTKASPGDVALPYPSDLSVPTGTEVTINIDGTETLSCTLQ